MTVVFLSHGCFAATEPAQQRCVYAVPFGIREQCGEEVAADQKLAGSSLPSLLEKASPKKHYWLATPGGWLAGQSSGTLHVRDQYHRRPTEAAFLKRTAANENALCGANPVRWRPSRSRALTTGRRCRSAARLRRPLASANGRRLAHSHRIESKPLSLMRGTVRLCDKAEFLQAGVL